MTIDSVLLSSDEASQSHQRCPRCARPAVVPVVRLVSNVCLSDEKGSTMNSKMARLAAVAAIGSVAALGISQAIGDARPVNGGRVLSTTLTGAAEAPGPGDSDGSGTAFISINPGLGELCFMISVTGITLPAIAAHVHEAPVGVPGPVVVPLTPPGADGTSRGCVIVDRDELKEIMQEPDEYYVNVHTTDFPGGAVRGQLSK